MNNVKRDHSQQPTENSHPNLQYLSALQCFSVYQLVVFVLFKCFMFLQHKNPLLLSKIILYTVYCNKQRSCIGWSRVIIFQCLVLMNVS